jgi:SAM-dependent methyltransferase
VIVTVIYMAVQEIFRIDDSRMPIRLGDARKVPSYAYENWGIPLGTNRPESDELYSCEWQGGSPRQMEYVVKAITSTGLGNFSQMLRDASSAAVEHILRTSKERINYLEPGAGVSTVNLYQRLIDEGFDVDRIFGTLVEPSAERMESSVAQLENMGLRSGKNFVAYSGKKDTDALVLVGPESQNVVAQVAQIHHHSYLDVPIATLAATLKPTGYFVSADWHNSMWEHPNRVLEYLMYNFDWETKDADLAAFCQMYPRAKEPAPKLLHGPDEKANEMIREFWIGWANVRRDAIAAGEFQPCDDILMLEGHRPVERYIETAESAGLSTTGYGVQRMMEYGILPSNPHQLVKGSSILNIVVFQKSLKR